MNSLKKTLFVIAFITLVGQTVRHGYYRWFAPSGSVLDKYDTLKGEIKKAPTLQDRDRRYDEVQKEVTAFESDKTKRAIPHNERYDTEPYKSRDQLRQAIQDWESNSREIHKIRFLWFVGLALLASGYIIYRKSSKWIGLATIIVAFGEMIYWTSPTFFSDTSVEVERLLTNKFIFSLASFILLVVTGYGTNVVQESDLRSN